MKSKYIVLVKDGYMKIKQTRVIEKITKFTKLTTIA